MWRDTLHDHHSGRSRVSETNENAGIMHLHNKRFSLKTSGFQLADWEVQPQINCVRKGEETHHLEPKVMQVLVQLATHRDEVLSKEQLIHAVWPDTFVGDDVLTRCISEIRRVLTDDPRSPRYIQTIPKTGYRLIAPVTFLKDRPSEPPPQSTPPQAAAAAAPEPAPNPVLVTNAPAAKRSLRPWLIAAVIVGAFVVGALAYTLLKSRMGQSTVGLIYRTYPFTSYPGVQNQPSFSPDGNQIAFVWQPEGDQHQAVYVKVLGTETPLRITDGTAEDYSPVYSPDGRSVAFLRASETESGIYIVPALGGPARKIYTPNGRKDWSRGTISWSSDGQHLIFPDGKSATSQSRIYRLDIDNRSAQPLSDPPAHWDGDYSPAYSPDGSKIAFTRAIDSAVRDLYVMSSNGGNATRLTFDNRFVSDLAWTSDSREIIFSSNRAGKSSLWKISAKGGTPERMSIGSEDAFHPAVSRQGNHLAYAQSSAKWSIVRVNLAAKDSVNALWSSTQEDSAPRFSPDGQRIAFQSWRSGMQEIWVAQADGSGPEKLTSFEASLTGSPDWSPNGKQIAFDSRPDGRSHIYTITVDGGKPRALTQGDNNDIVPSWSRDGRWIYFGSNRGGAWQIWKVSANGGEPIQVTQQGGFVGMESYDGQWLYFAKADEAGLWRIPTSGGEETKVLDQPRASYWGYWTVGRAGIYYLNMHATPPQVELLAMTGGRPTHIYTMKRFPPLYAGLTISPDGRTLLYNELTEPGSHITLAEREH